MRSICIFSCYFDTSKIPQYIKVYIEELSNYFDELILVFNDNIVLSESEYKYLNELKIQPFIVKNEGWDFGMWYKVIKTLDLSKYKQVGLINDSCILLRKIDDFFNWAETNNLDYFGMLDSPQRKYHIQSYFLIFRPSIYEHILDYLKKNNLYEKKEEVINNYEIGLSQYLISKGMKIGSFYSYKNYYEYNSIKPNPFHAYIGALLSDKFPLLKKERLWQLHKKRIEFLKTSSCIKFYDKDLNFKTILKNLENINSVSEIIEKQNSFYRISDYIEQAIFFESVMNKHNKKSKLNYLIEKIKKRLKLN